MGETTGHYPAPLAILDCLERGLVVPMDAAVGIELDIFADLIKRPEPRNMIQTLFIARQDYDKRRKAGELPAFVDEIVRSVSAPWRTRQRIIRGWPSMMRCASQASRRRWMAEIQLARPR